MTGPFRKLSQFTKLKWRVKPPGRRNVLLYFSTGRDVVAPYFSSDEFQVLDLKENEINLPVLFSCIIARDISAKNYARQFILRAKPKLILTFIDNFPPFYQLKNEFPDIKTLLIQNGIRSHNNDLFGLLSNGYSDQKNAVDYMFVFGNAVGAKYREHISGNLIIHGSFKNNLFPKKVAKKSSIAYISTYRPNQSRSAILAESNPGKPVTYNEIILRREQVVGWIAQYSANQNMSLTIIGKDEDPKLEENYYRAFLGKYSFDFVAKEHSLTSYKAIDQSEMVVFTSSTLGYESLARGNKTAAVILDAEIIGSDALKFGWPAELESEGKFWTHQLSEKRLIEILDYLKNVSDSDWNQTRSDVMKQVIEFDPGNSQFVKLIKSLKLSE